MRFLVVIPHFNHVGTLRGVVQEALKAAEEIDATVDNVCCLKPLDEETILEQLKAHKRAYACEEHSVIGGLGSAVCDALCAKHPVPVKKLGMQDVFGESGSAAALVEKYKLDGKGVYADVKAFLNK